MAYNGGFTFSGGYDGDTDPDYIYYNATIINNRTDVNNNLSGWRFDPAIRFLETRDVPIIKDASKYNFSIIRFTMDGPNKDLPLFLPVIRTGAVANPTQDVNLTIYSVSLRLTLTGAGAGTYTYTQPIIYSPETQDTNVAPVPAASTTVSGQDVSTRYYWVYTYGHWLSLVNQAFAGALAGIQALVTAAGGPTLATTAPVMTWNPTTRLFSLLADRTGFGGSDRTSATENFEVYFNNNMFGLFANFRNIYYNEPNSEVDNLIYTGQVGQYQNLLVVPSGTPTPSGRRPGTGSWPTTTRRGRRAAGGAAPSPG
jgi:hypothetical protein